MRRTCGSPLRDLLRQGLLNLAQNGVQAILGAIPSPCGPARASRDTTSLPWRTRKWTSPMRTWTRSLTSSYTAHLELNGIGLALLYRIARMHGGAVRIRAAAVQGTTVTIPLPQLAAPDRGGLPSARPCLSRRSQSWPSSGTPQSSLFLSPLRQRRCALGGRLVYAAGAVPAAAHGGGGSPAAWPGNPLTRRRGARVRNMEADGLPPAEGETFPAMQSFAFSRERVRPSRPGAMCGPPR